MHFKLASYFQTACRKGGFSFYPHQLLLLYESSLSQDVPRYFNLYQADKGLFIVGIFSCIEVV